MTDWQTQGVQIRACVGNYGYYNEGELRDRWVSLPMEPKKLDAFLRESGLLDDEHEETYISDYDGLPLKVGGDVFGENADLDDLNTLALVMQGMSDWQRTAVECYFDAVDGAERVLDVINVCLQADDIPLSAYDYDGAWSTDQWGQTCVERLSPEENFGYTLIESGCCEELRQLLDEDTFVSSAFDVERYGRMVAEADNVSLYDDCYLYADCCEDIDMHRWSREEVSEIVEGAIMGRGDDTIGGDADDALASRVVAPAVEADLSAGHVDERDGEAER